MIIFEKGNSRSGKKQRWSHKYPRARINHLGGDRQAHKEAGWFKHNWNDDNYSYFRGNLHKFLLANVGRPIDKVFSEFLGRCSKSLSSYNLKEKFYDYIEKKEEIDWTGGFYVTNGILNYKKRTKRPISKPYVSLEDFNRKALPVLNPICRACDETHTKQFLGVFRFTYNTQSRVYIVEKSVYDADLKLQVRYKPCYIHGVGNGVYETHWGFQGKLNNTSYEPYSNWCHENPYSKYIFITKK